MRSRAEHLPAGRAAHAEEVRAGPGRRCASPSVVLEMIGKIATTTAHSDERDPRVLDPDDDERRDRDDRRHLQQHRVGKEAHLDPPALHEQRARRASPTHDRRSRAPSSAMPSVTPSDASSSARSATSVRHTAERRRHEVGRHVVGDDESLPQRRAATRATSAGAAKRSTRDRRRASAPGSSHRLARRRPRRRRVRDRRLAVAPRMSVDTRNASPRGYGSSIATSAMMRPGPRRPSPRRASTGTPLRRCCA